MYPWGFIFLLKSLLVKCIEQIRELLALKIISAICMNPLFVHFLVIRKSEKTDFSFVVSVMVAFSFSFSGGRGNGSAYEGTVSANALKGSMESGCLTKNK